MEDADTLLHTVWEKRVKSVNYRMLLVDLMLDKMSWTAHLATYYIILIMLTITHKPQFPYT
jgi:hypothetical protein